MKPELLAPAGSPAALHAAVDAGADAVYFGAQSFNARKNAENFTEEGLYDAIRYCRLFCVKTHIVLNTQLYNRELEPAVALVRQLLLWGILEWRLPVPDTLRKQSPRSKSACRFMPRLESAPVGKLKATARILKYVVVHWLNSDWTGGRPLPNLPSRHGVKNGALGSGAVLFRVTGQENSELASLVKKLYESYEKFCREK